MKTVQINSYDFHYIEEGAGNPVIFVHGSVSDQRTWENQIAPFARQFYTIAYSRRFHHPFDSEVDASNYTVLQHSRDLIAFIEALDLEPVHIVGSSYGAYTGLIAAMQRPDLVKTLVMGEPPIIPLLVPNMNNPFHILSLLVRDFSTGKSFLKFGMKAYSPAQKQLRKGNLEEGVRLFTNGVLGDGGFEKLSSMAQKGMVENGSALRAELLGPGFSKFPKDKVSRLQIPALLAYGEKSPKFFHSISDILFQLLPDRQQVFVPDASHNIHAENPEVYNRKVLDFLLQQS